MSLTSVPEQFVLIIGAMKAGTTSLFDYLRTHPQILGSRKKEPNFFSANRIFARGPEYYYGLWKDFSPDVHRYVLEASPDYTKYPRHPMTAHRIAEYPGRFKLIYILRDPIDRIESHIAHNIAKGRVTVEDHAAMLPGALDVSRYAFQIDHVLSVLGTTPLLLDFAALKDDPGTILQRCVDFLGIDPDFKFEPRQPSNPRSVHNGAGAFRLDTDTRQRLQTVLDHDVRRLHDVYGFEIAAWGFPITRGLAPAVTAVATRAAAAEATSRGKALRREPTTGLSLAATARPLRRRRDYWARRHSMMYYRYVLEIGRRLSRDARSLIDVGSHTTSVAEAFDWVPERLALDIRQPYSSAGVQGVKADFLTWEHPRRFDFALCLQVLEHIPDAGSFARKLLAVADRVLVSVPYLWPAGACRNHCQDPVDETKLAGWFGRTPDYAIVVDEPFRRVKGRRLIAYYHRPDEPFDLRKFRRKGRRKIFVP